MGLLIFNWKEKEQKPCMNQNSHSSQIAVGNLMVNLETYLLILFNHRIQWLHVFLWKHYEKIKSRKPFFFFPHLGMRMWLCELYLSELKKKLITKVITFDRCSSCSDPLLANCVASSIAFVDNDIWHNQWFMI